MRISVICILRGLHMRFNTRKDRKKFVLIYTVLLVIMPLAFFCINLFQPNMALWQKVAISIMIWNLIGGIHFVVEDNIAEIIIGRFIAIVMIFVFPFFYLYQMLCLITHNDETN